METLYFYVFNIRTNNIKIDQCKIEEITTNYWGDVHYHLLCMRNGKTHRFMRKISNIDSFDVERNNISISACSYDGTKIEEFKKKCIKLILEYKEKCEYHIEQMEENIRFCNKSIEFLSE